MFATVEALWAQFNCAHSCHSLCKCLYKTHYLKWLSRSPFHHHHSGSRVRDHNATTTGCVFLPRPGSGILPLRRAWGAVLCSLLTQLAIRRTSQGWELYGRNMKHNCGVEGNFLTSAFSLVIRLWTVVVSIAHPRRGNATVRLVEALILMRATRV